jgi:hypothetical protein
MWSSSTYLIEAKRSFMFIDYSHGSQLPVPGLAGVGTCSWHRDGVVADAYIDVNPY